MPRQARAGAGRYGTRGATARQDGGSLYVAETFNWLKYIMSRFSRNYRRLTLLGITTQNTAVIIIGTCCIERGHALLHDDRDFAPMEELLGPRVG